MQQVFQLNKANVIRAALPYFLFGGAAFIIGALAGLSPFWAVLLTGGPLALLLLISLPSNKNSITARWPFAFLLGYLFVLTSWPHYAGVKIPGLFQLQPFRALYFVLLIYSVYTLRTSESFRRDLLNTFKSNKPLVMAVVAFVFFQIVAAAFGKGMVFSLSMLFKETIIPAILMLICVALIKDEERIRAALVAILLSAFFVSLVGIVESFKEKNLFASLVPATDEWAAIATTERFRGGRYRAQSTFDSPLVLVDFLATVFPIALYFIADKVKLFRVMGSVCAVLIALAIIRTQSRAGVGIVAVEAGLIYVLVKLKDIRFGKPSAMTWFSIIVIFSSVLIVIPFLGLIVETLRGSNTEEVGSTAWRIFMINGAIKMLLNFEWFGNGIGYGAPSIGIQVPTKAGFWYVLDSYYLTVFSDSGLLSLISYVAWSFGVVFCGIKLYFSGKNAGGNLGLILSVSIIGFLAVKAISSQTQIFPLFYVLCVMILLLNTWSGLKQREVSVV